MGLLGPLGGSGGVHDPGLTLRRAPRTAFLNPVRGIEFSVPYGIMPVSSHDFRRALRGFPSGVTIVTIRVGELVHGLTVSAFASVSPVPPLIGVIIDHKHSAYELLETEGAVFAVNILRQEHMELSNRFAWVKDTDRFEEGSWSTATTGAPILEDALAWLDCTIHSRHEAGTHTIYVGEVQDTGVLAEGAQPLVYWNQGYRRLEIEDEPRPPQSPEEPEGAGG